MYNSLPIESNNHQLKGLSNDTIECITNNFWAIIGSSEVIKSIVNNILQNLYGKPHSNV